MAWWSEASSKLFRTAAPPVLFSTTVLALSYFSFGIWTTLIFTSGFLGGLILWMAIPASHVPFSAIKAPYYLAFVFFIVLHKVEENVFKFQEELSKITGTPVPDVTSLTLIALVLLSVGGWLLIPFLFKRGYAFGRYLAWTFFSAMGITELAHFVFPFFIEGPYRYFPGMVSVIALAPAAWWGMSRLARETKF